MDEVEKAALTAWERTDDAQRHMWTRMRLLNLSKLAGIMRENDRIDAARGIWLEYIDGRDAVGRFARNRPEIDPDDLRQMAAVLADVAAYLPEDHVVDFAARTFATHEFEVHVTEQLHVGWSPFDRALTIIRGDVVAILTDGVGV